MTKRKPIVSEMTQSYETTEKWIAAFLSESNIVLLSKDIAEIRDFRYEIWDFLHGIESRWMGKSVWKLWVSGKIILAGYQELRGTELKLARVIEDLKREQVILDGMRKTALPDEGSQPANTRKVSGWNQYPKRYPPIIKSKIKDARLPEHIGD